MSRRAASDSPKPGFTVPASPTNPDARDQGRAWSRHAERYEELFLDPFRPGVTNPLLELLEARPQRRDETVADLGCGTGPLLPWLLERFGRVIALDFAPGMIEASRQRLGPEARRVEFLQRSMEQLDDFEGTLDVAVAFNSVVMPDTRVIDRTLVAIRRALKPGGVFAAILPAMDAILYHTMLLYELGLERGGQPEEAARFAALHAEHSQYDFALGRFTYLGLRQKFWHPFEIEWRFARAGFVQVELVKVLYPWDDQFAQAEALQDQPRTWDWGVLARPHADPTEGRPSTPDSPPPQRQHARSPTKRRASPEPSV